MPAPYLLLTESSTREVTRPAANSCSKKVPLLLFVALSVTTLLSSTPYMYGRGGEGQEHANAMYSDYLAKAPAASLRPGGHTVVPRMTQRSFREASGFQSKESWSASSVRPPSVTSHGGLAVSRAEFDHSGLMGAGANIQNPGEYPDMAFINECKKRFPAEGIADTFQARCLLALDYKYIDVRTAFEYDEGHVMGSVNIPLIISSRPRFDSSVGDRVFADQQPNPDFIKEVEKRFPDKHTPIMIGCSDGRLRSIDALEALDAAGYDSIVGIKGGYLRWQTKYDGKLRRRREEKQREVYGHKGDSSGVHSLDAGLYTFSSSGMGIKEDVPLKDKNEWVEFAPASSR
eukprot:gnl/TRDRNA2_/TRDRNA2_29855_c0_seq1.p1 gnl/TRDRNA2_/TRDRNA2_29855_c0~~gnl/TRDRNA2_/TRDRNA2_29855_c0_seq1.p1  ORF type:complete len:345 (-),score=52.42 gnl/TRDRNA2_/TRDRNA2_29855_c0_seq1:74-1108(-)